MGWMVDKDSGAQFNVPDTVNVAKLHDTVARFRTALVAMLELAQRQGGYMEWNDQMLLKEVERLLEDA